MGRWAQSRRRGRHTGRSNVPPPVYGVDWVLDPEADPLTFNTPDFAPWPKIEIEWETSGFPPFIPDDAQTIVTGVENSIVTATDASADQWSRARWKNAAGIPVSNWSEVHYHAAP